MKFFMIGLLGFVAIAASTNLAMAQPKEYKIKMTIRLKRFFNGRVGRKNWLLGQLIMFVALLFI